MQNHLPPLERSHEPDLGRFSRDGGVRVGLQAQETLPDKCFLACHTAWSFGGWSGRQDAALYGRRDARRYQTGVSVSAR
jgi:hypothetical protein